MPEHTIAETLSRLVTAKTDIANAIATMGGVVGQNDGFEEFPADILGIPTSSGVVARYIYTYVDSPSSAVGVGSGLVVYDGQILTISGTVLRHQAGYFTIQFNFPLSDIGFNQEMTANVCYGNGNVTTVTLSGTSNSIAIYALVNKATPFYGKWSN